MGIQLFVGTTRRAGRLTFADFSDGYEVALMFLVRLLVTYAFLICCSAASSALIVPEQHVLPKCS
jgi:hypothetical protein